jgi:SAM-dependent methyltransferase
VYDATVGRIAPYRHLQESCVAKLALEPGDHILSVGVGTGNEVQRLLRAGPSTGARISAVDLSGPALKRAGKKAARLRHRLDPARMDAHHLGFRDAVFDGVICVHTMDFLTDHTQASREILRVLKPGGAFVITYPSGRGSRGLGAEVGKSAWASLRRGNVVSALAEAGAAAGAGAVYLPLALSLHPAEGFYSTSSLRRFLDSVGLHGAQVEEDPVYQDFIVWGRK